MYMTTDPIEEQEARKRELRTSLRRQRDDLPLEWRQEYAARLCALLWERLQGRGVKVLHTYLPMGSELDVTPLIARALQAGWTVVCPRTLPKGQLEHLRLQGLQQVAHGRFGTMYPSGGQGYAGPYDAILVPGLAFDAAGNRLGYGGGYYDRFLPQQSQAFKVAPVYPFQLVEELPVQAHDRPVDWVCWLP